MSTLQENLDAIKLDKNTNLKPENLKKDVTCLGVTGTYEGSGDGTVEGVKQFATQEEMQADTTAKEGDLAVVYRSEIQNATVDSRFQIATFPNTVILDTAITDYVDVRYRPVDSSVMFDCRGSLDNSMFMMDCHTENGSIRIQYTSSDGITYTRTDTTGNPVDFGTEIYYVHSEMWNDDIGKFIQIGSSTFEGLFEYTLNVNDVDYISTKPSNYLNVTTRKQSDYVYADTVTANPDIDVSTLIKCDIKNITNILGNIAEEQSLTGSDYFGVVIKNDGNILAYHHLNSGQVVYDTNGVYIGYLTCRSESDVYPLKKYLIDVASSTYTVLDDITPTLLSNNSSDALYGIPASDTDNILPVSMSCKTVFVNGVSGIYCIDSEGELRSGGWSECNVSPYYMSNKYLYAPTQLTLNNSNQLLPGVIGYGKNGVGTGTLVQDISNSFADINAEVYSKIQQEYDSMEPRVLTDSDKTIDKNIYFVPVKKDGTVLLDTSNVTNMTNMFSSCTNLTEIPLLNTSNVTNMYSMFSSCTNLTEIPLLDTSSVTNMTSMFSSCTNLTEIPLLDTSSVTSMTNMFSGCTNLTEIPLLNTSNVTNMYSMFSGCKNLITIPLLDTSSVTSMTNMFSVCIGLSDESLNNILAMCANATSYAYTKTLKYIGLTSEQATKCTTLSNYSAFTAAGWATGY